MCYQRLEFSLLHITCRLRRSIETDAKVGRCRDINDDDEKEMQDVDEENIYKWKLEADSSVCIVNVGVYFQIVKNLRSWHKII